MTFTSFAILALIAGWLLFTYNRLIRLRNQVRTAWADIDVQLTRRHDLVPQLVAAVKGYASHEQTLLQAVTELRSRAMQVRDPAGLGEIETALEQGLSRLFALQEAYPALQASENFMQLHRDLVEIEQHLQYARRFYNGAVRDYNDTVQRIPDIVVARGFHFVLAEFYQAQPQERAAVQVGSAA